MVEALVQACNDNWDFAWELLPEDDYLTGRIENYDEQTHEVYEKGNLDGRYVRGVLYFVRLHTEIADIAVRLKEKRQQSANAELAESVAQHRPATGVSAPRPGGKRLRANKNVVRQLVDKTDVAGLVALCLDDRKTLRLMQRLLYDPVPEKRWHVGWLMGQVCGRVASRDPGQVSELLHRLFEACNDSAASHWGMVEALGSVIAERPDIFGAFTRYLLNFVAQDSTRAQVIWALGEIAERRPDLIRDTPFYNLFHFLRHPDATICGLVARLLGRIHASEATMQIMVLCDDERSLQIWEKGAMVSTTVAAEATKALKTIQGGVNTTT